MPLVDGQLMSPDDAIAANRCPECGKDLTQVNPIAHRKSHWHRMPNDDVDGQEGRRRMALLDDFIVKNKVRTSDQPKPKPNAAPIE
jgi:hypothetical protein